MSVNSIALLTLSLSSRNGFFVFCRGNDKKRTQNMRVVVTWLGKNYWSFHYNSRITDMVFINQHALLPLARDPTVIPLETATVHFLRPPIMMLDHSSSTTTTAAALRTICIERWDDASDRRRPFKWGHFSMFSGGRSLPNLADWEEEDPHNRRRRAFGSPEIVLVDR